MGYPCQTRPNNHTPEIDQNHLKSILNETYCKIMSTTPGTLNEHCQTGSAVGYQWQMRSNDLALKIDLSDKSTKWNLLQNYQYHPVNTEWAPPDSFCGRIPLTDGRKWPHPLNWPRSNEKDIKWKKGLPDSFWGRVPLTDTPKEQHSQIKLSRLERQPNEIK